MTIKMTEAIGAVAVAQCYQVAILTQQRRVAKRRKLELATTAALWLIGAGFEREEVARLSNDEAIALYDMGRGEKRAIGSTTLTFGVGAMMVRQ